MRIRTAAFNSFPFHYEMIGIVLNYSQDIPVYTNFENDLGWFQYYNIRFPLARFIHYTQFDPDNFDRIILLTDDDPNIPLNTIPSHKIFCIDHFHRKRVSDELVHMRMSTRYFKDREDQWAIPTFNMIPKKVKISKLATTRRIGVACVGASLHDCDFNDVEKQLRSLIINFDNVDFYLMGRYLYGLDSDYPNIFIKSDVSTTEIVDTLRDCDYMLMFVPARYNGRLYEAMSGCLPLAFNTGCRIIMPNKEYMDAYKLKSPLLIESKPITLVGMMESDVEAVYDEASEQEQRFKDAMACFINT